MNEEKKKINGWVPVSLWENVEKLGYDSPTRAICDGFEMLVNGYKNPRSGYNPDILDTADTKGYNPDILDTKGYNPDTESQVLREVLREAQAHNESLKKELEKAAQDKEDLKQIHNNYMLQVQSLINQKAIVAPGAKKIWWKFW